MKSILFRALFSHAEWIKILKALKELDITITQNTNYCLMEVYDINISPDETLALMEMLGIET